MLTGFIYDKATSSTTKSYFIIEQKIELVLNFYASSSGLI